MQMLGVQLGIRAKCHLELLLLSEQMLVVIESQVNGLAVCHMTCLWHPHEGFLLVVFMPPHNMIQSGFNSKARCCYNVLGGESYCELSLQQARFCFVA